MNNKMPLVSVCMITYNVSKFVIDALESVKKQTYQNIELIISDDCSTDDTIKIVEEWLKDNYDRFVRTKLIISPINTGQSGNRNRGEKECNGEWIQHFDGDDMLYLSCIDDFISYVKVHPDAWFVFGKAKVFGLKNEEENMIIENNTFDYNFLNKDACEQYKYLLNRNSIPSNVFLNREKCINLNIPYDERIPMVDDWPRWISITSCGIKLHFVDKFVLKYRKGHVSTTGVFNIKTSKCFWDVFVFYVFPNLYELDKTEALKTMSEIGFADVYKVYDMYQKINVSKAYKLGKFLLKPFSLLRNVR